MTDIKTVPPNRSDIVDAAISELKSAFIDVTLHAQTAFKLVAYIESLEAAVLAASANQEAALRKAAKEFYNATLADTRVTISCPTAELRDDVFNIGKQLRAAIEASQSPQDQVKEK